MVESSAIKLIKGDTENFEVSTASGKSVGRASDF